MALWSRKQLPAGGRRGVSGSAVSPYRQSRKVYPQRPRRMPHIRGYDGASVNNLTYSMASQPVSANEDIRMALRRLRARVRQLGNNDPLLRGFYSQVERNVVGESGIVMRPDVRFGGGGPDDAANMAIRDEWSWWGSRCEFKGEMPTFADVQRIVMRSVAEDGEAIVQRVRGKQARAHGMSLLLIDVERLNVDYNEDLAGGSYIRMGIERDKYGRKTAYHILSSGGSSDSYVYGGHHYSRIPAQDIYHVYWRDRVEQDRGVPWAAPTLMRLSMLDGYEEAALVAARTGASKHPVLQMDEGASEYTGDDSDQFGNPIIDAGTPGAPWILPLGYRIADSDPTYPTGDLPPFVKTMKQDIAAGFSVNYPTLSGDLEGVNYSSLRHGNLTERDFWKMLQAFLVGQFNDRVREDWLYMALAGEHIRIKGYPLNFANFERYNKAKWRGRRWEAIDPLKQANSDEKDLANGTTSEIRLCDERGTDFEEVVREQAEANRIREKHKVGKAKSPATPGAQAGGVGEENGASNGDQ